MFLLVCVILFTGGVCLSACWDTPQEGGTPRDHAPPQTMHPPGRRHPRDQAPLSPGPCTPGTMHPPPPPPPPGIRSMSGRYASYWNAFLSNIILHFLSVTSVMIAFLTDSFFEQCQGFHSAKFLIEASGSLTAVIRRSKYIESVKPGYRVCYRALLK